MHKTQRTIHIAYNEAFNSVHDSQEECRSTISTVQNGDVQQSTNVMKQTYYVEEDYKSNNANDLSYNFNVSEEINVASINKGNNNDFANEKNNFVNASDERTFNNASVENLRTVVKAPFQIFKEELASLFVETNTSIENQKKFLNFLRKHECFINLPKKPETLLGTPRIFKKKIIDIPPGQYLHLGFEKALTKILNRIPLSMICTDTLLIDVNIDGCELNKKYKIIPIQVKISNIPESDVEVVGFYVGRTKPFDVNLFLTCFITDVNRVREDNYSNKAFKVEIRLFCLDLVARAYILRHKNHNSLKPCIKCKVKGFRYKHTSVYLGVNHQPRTDNEHARTVGKGHHTGKSPLLKLGIRLVTQVPIDGMHCIYLGVHKIMLVAWMTGTYGKQVKLSSDQILQMSQRILVVKKYCPREFARLPEILKYFKEFKATEHRQFLLYYGTVITNGIVSNNTYLHYVLLSTAIRCLSFKSPSYCQLSFARLALKKFILGAELIYNLNFMSSNIHNLNHLVDDVEKFGPLDSYGAWAYENNVTFFRKYYRKPGTPIQQIDNRMVEREKHNVDKVKIRRNDNHIKLFNPWFGGPLPRNIADEVLQSWTIFQNLEYKNFTF